MFEIARNSKKIRTYSSSRSSKVIDLGVNRKPVYDFLLVINSNFGPKTGRIWLYPTVFEILTHLENTLFLPPLPCLMPPSGGTSWDINIIYTPLKSTFSGLQFCHRHGSIFIHLAVVASENREIRRSSVKIWHYSSSRSSKVIDLDVNRKPICDFLLVINCNYSRTVFEIFRLGKPPPFTTFAPWGFGGTKSHPGAPWG